MEQSTQWGVSLPNTFPMKRHLKSRNPLQNFGAYHLEFSSSIRQLIGLRGLFCQLNGPEQGSLITMI